MKTVVTDISVRHLPLIKIFFEANKLFDIGMKLDHTDIDASLTYSIDANLGTGRSYKIEATKSVITFEYDEDNDEHVGTVTFMGIKHMGFTNMLHDYLNKCGYANHTQ